MELITYKITGEIALIIIEGDMLRKDRVEERDKSR